MSAKRKKVKRAAGVGRRCNERKAKRPRKKGKASVRKRRKAKSRMVGKARSRSFALALARAEAKARRLEAERVSEHAHRMLLESVEAVAERRDIVLKEPDRWFTRLRKVSLADLLCFLVFSSEDTTGAELCDYFGWDGTAPSVSALTQLRKKLTPEAMPELLREFLSRFDPVPYLDKYRLVAADGTGVGIARNADKRTEVTSNQYGRHRNEMHPTMSFDPMRGNFEDMVVQGSKVQNEPVALCELIDRFEPGKAPDGRTLVALWLADRNFATYNVLCHLMEAGACFALRCRDEWARRVLGDDFAGGEFDVTVDRYFTRSRRVDGRSRPDEPELYRVIDSATPFDALPKGSRGEYHMRLRFVRVAIPAAKDGDAEDENEPSGTGGDAATAKADAGEKAKADGKGEKDDKDEEDKNDKKDHWITIVTNLTAEEGFDAQALVALYGVRWAEEVGIRYLKHTCGMRDPRCRDYERAEQEIWGRVILASACALATAGVEKPEPGPKRERAVDVTMAFKAFLRMLAGRADVNLEAVCGRFTHSVRPGRHFERRKSKESRVRLCYRH